MITIRQGTFETNSSSTHSMVICTKDVFDKWENNELFYLTYGSYSKNREKGFYTKEQVINFMLEDYEEFTREQLETMDIEEFIDLIREDEFVTYDNWESHLEHDSETYTTPSGETIVVECAYGYD